MSYKKEEINNFENNLSLNKLPSNSTFMIYDICFSNPDNDKSYQELFNSMRVIISNSVDEWPNDSEWRALFSESFNDHFPNMTRQQCDEMLKNKPKESWGDLPWDFGSWLDVLKRRTWRWVAHQRKGKYLQIALSVKDPNAGDLEAFDEIFNACGVKVVRREIVRL